MPRSRPYLSALLFPGIVLYPFVLSGAAVAAFWALGTTIPGLLIAAVLLWSMLPALLAAGPPVPGRAVSEAEAPDLWADVHALAQRLGAAPPDAIRIGVHPVVQMDERYRLAGLVPGERCLAIGAPLMAVATRGEVRAAVARALADESPQVPGLEAYCHRSLRALDDLMRKAGTGRAGSALRLMWPYARLLVAVQVRHSRTVAVAADAFAAREAGTENALALIDRFPLLACAFDRFDNAYLGDIDPREPVPEGVSTAFATALAVHADDLTEGAGPAEPGPADPTPGAPERRAALGSAVFAAPADSGDRARDYVIGFPAIAVDAESDFFSPGSPRVTWDEFTAGVHVRELGRQAASGYRSLARATGVPSPSLGDLLAGFRNAPEDFASALREAGATRSALRAMAATAAVDSGAVGFEHDWTFTPPARMVTTNGSGVSAAEFDAAFDTLADACLDGSLDAVEKAFARLADTGVDVAAATDATRAPAADLTVRGAAGLVKFDRRRCDVYAYRDGLVVVPCRRWSAMVKPVIRVTRILKRIDGIDELLTRPGAVHLPKEDLTAVDWASGWSGRLRLTLVTRDGAVHSLREIFSTEKIGPYDTTVRNVLDSAPERTGKRPGGPA